MNARQIGCPKTHRTITQNSAYLKFGHVPARPQSATPHCIHAAWGYYFKYTAMSVPCIILWCQRAQNVCV
jgi:hypothetical protein